jgi:hypothetical protein
MPWQCIYLMNKAFSNLCEPADTQTYAQQVTVGDRSKFTPTPAVIA